MIGFVDIGEINNHLLRFERQCMSSECHPPVATHMLVFMIRGIFTGLRFPYVHFPTANVTSDQLYNLLWEAVERLEHKGFVVCADGASTNRKLFRMHGVNTSSSPYNPLYKTVNIYTDDQRPLFFIADVPHLLKTTRNNWSHSFSHSCTRKLWVSSLL